MITLLRDLVVACGITCAVTFLFYRRYPKWYRYLAGPLALSVCALLLLSITGVSSLGTFQRELHVEAVQLVPFKGIKTVLYHGFNRYARVNIVGNVLMFLPFGLLWCILVPQGKKWYVTIPLGFLFSVLIEVTQLFLLRGTDVDDVLLNTIGTALGFGLGCLAERAVSKGHSEEGSEKNMYGKRHWVLCVITILIPYACAFLLNPTFWRNIFV